MKPKGEAVAGLFGEPGALRARREAFERYAEWERANPSHLDPAAAIAGIGFLYDLMDPVARDRPFDPSGIANMHRKLATLSKLSS